MAAILFLFLSLGSGVVQALATDAGEQISQCATEGECGASFAMNSMSLLQLQGTLNRDTAAFADEAKGGENECAPGDKDCSKEVQVVIPPFKVEIGCCKDCPCQSTTPPPPVFQIVPPQKYGYCSFSGDPHIHTFDGARAGSRNSGIYWFVHSPKGVQIQGEWGGAGRVYTLAFGGEWMKGHKIIVNARKKWLELDGKMVLTKDGDKHSVEGVCDLERVPKGGWKLSEAQIKELDGAKQNAWPAKAKHWSNHGGLFHLKLPSFTDVWIRWGDSTEMVIKMPTQPESGGWCGNFNGDPNDDTDRSPNKEGRSKDPMRGQIRDAADSFFKTSSSMMQEDKEEKKKHKKKRKDENECSTELKAKAKKACEHIPDKPIYEDCIFDICYTEDLKFAEAAEDAEIMRMKVAKGIIDFEGHGRCLDQTGEEFTAVKAAGVTDMQECMDLMTLTIKHQGALSKFRGAQFTDGSGDGDESCEFLLEAGEEAKSLLEELPGLWGNKVDKEGKGVVSTADSEKGWYCWAFID